MLVKDKNLFKIPLTTTDYKQADNSNAKANNITLYIKLNVQCYVR